MLAELQQEQDQKQAELKMKRAEKRSSETRHASTQCSSGVASQLTADAAVQTDHYDVITELREQIQGLKEVVRDLTTLKSVHQHETEMTPSSEPMFNEQLPDVQLDPAFAAAITSLCNGPPEQEEISTEPTGSQPSIVQNQGEEMFPTYSSHTASSRQPLMSVENFVPQPPVSHGPTDEQRSRVARIVDLSPDMSNATLACVDVLFNDDELARGNMSGTRGYQQLDTYKLGFLISSLKRKFESPNFTAQWNEIVPRINSKCRGKRRTLISKLKKNNLF